MTNCHKMFDHEHNKLSFQKKNVQKNETTKKLRNKKNPIIFFCMENSIQSI